MTAVVVIPARFASTRFPGKMLASDTGKPLVQHVVEQARKARQVREVIVATDDPRIESALRPFGTQCVMTDPSHPSGTDRIAQVARDLRDDVIVNVQGDEPEIEPATIDGLIELLRAKSGHMATAATRFGAAQDPSDPNLVKVVLTGEDRALYFSRAPIPWHRDETDRARQTYYLHLGIYAYSRPFLVEFARWKPTPLEQAEKLEQLRALEHGEAIWVLKVDRATNGIDTRQQYEEFVRRVNR